VVAGDDRAQGKAPTSRHHIADGFKGAIEYAAADLGYSFDELIARTELIRYATTISLNTLIQRSGPKLGLITTAGFEDVIYMGRARQ